MSIHLIREVLQYAPPDLTASERLVLICLSEDARDDRIARYSSNERLRQQTGLSAAGLSKTIRSLESAGLIRRQGNAHKGRIQQYLIAQLQAHHQATNVHYLPVTDRHEDEPDHKPHRPEENEMTYQAPTDTPHRQTTPNQSQTDRPARQRPASAPVRR